MDTEKKVYEEPTAKMVEFDFSDRIAASGCTDMNQGLCPGAVLLPF